MRCTGRAGFASGEFAVTDEAALLAAIIAEPSEDTLRLAFADWLDENDQPERAEFIRVQVEIARHVADWAASDGNAASELDDLRRRERELQHGSDKRGVINEFRWLGSPLRSFIYGAYCEPQFRRGFVHQLMCRWDQWLAHAGAILKQNPIELVKLTTMPRLSGAWKDGDSCIFHLGELEVRFPWREYDDRVYGRRNDVSWHEFLWKKVWRRIEVEFPPPPYETDLDDPNSATFTVNLPLDLAAAGAP